MFRRLGTTLAVFLLVLAFVLPKAAAENSFGQIDSIVKSLSGITGFSELHPVAYGRMNKRQLRHFLTKRIRRTLRPEEIHADEVALKMFGLVPQSFDLKESTIELLTEQAAAFYDYDEKKLFLLQDSSFSSEVMTLAHELSHALADQHFNLGKYMDDANMQDDENLAHSAVVEGQASWLMIAYELKQNGQPPEPTQGALDSVLDSSEGSMSDYPVLKNSPLYIQQSLLFPYTEGTLFFDAVYKKLNKAAFSAVFTDPPIDSAQVLHPRRYFEHVKPTEPPLPELVELKGAPKVNDGSLGEFDHRILLWQFTDEQSGKLLAAHLKGSDFRIAALGKEERPVLVYASQWDGDEAAEEFFHRYERVLNRKWKMCDVSVRKRSLLEGEGDDGFFVVRLSGDVVTSVEGLPTMEMMRSVEKELSVEEVVASRVH